MGLEAKDFFKYWNKKIKVAALNTWLEFYRRQLVPRISSNELKLDTV